jgi:hypothetical protein
VVFRVAPGVFFSWLSRPKRRGAHGLVCCGFPTFVSACSSWGWGWAGQRLADVCVIETVVQAGCPTARDRCALSLKHVTTRPDSGLGRRMASMPCARCLATVADPRRVEPNSVFPDRTRTVVSCCGNIAFKFYKSITNDNAAA